jgi:hypothetical protein
MLNFAKKHQYLRKILLEISDEDMAYSNDNSFCAHTHKDRSSGRYDLDDTHDGDDNIIIEYSSNLLIDSLTKEVWRLFDNYLSINGHGWDWGTTEYFTVLHFDMDDFLIVNIKDTQNGGTKQYFKISKKFQKYLDDQFNKLIEYCTENIDQMLLFHEINSLLQNSNINIFSLYYKRQSGGFAKNEYLLLELFQIKCKNQNIFLILFLISEQLHNVKRINKDYLYNKNVSNFHFYRSFTIIEYLKSVISNKYDEYTFCESSTFIVFVNLLLCYRLLNGSWEEEAFA